MKRFSVTPYQQQDHNLEVRDESLMNPEICEEVIDIDGELKGLTPFSCEVLPRALEVII